MAKKKVKDEVEIVSQEPEHMLPQPPINPLATAKITRLTGNSIRIDY